MTELTITGKVPPPVTIANVSPSNGLGLRFSTRGGVLCIDTDRRVMPESPEPQSSDVSHAPGGSGVMLMPSKTFIPN
jgi:hypothetical protein